MVDTSATQTTAASSEAQSRAKILEGVDFIETEEDVEAVESAVVKIQSTFRGKKIRSKLGQKEKPGEKAEVGADSEKADKSQDKSKPAVAAVTSAKATVTEGGKAAERKSSRGNKDKEEEELNRKVATMQVNDNKTTGAAAADSSADAQAAKQAPNNLPEEEAERAATKIQAGFKGYKTRKELEGKLGSQQMAGPAGAETNQDK